MQPAFLSTIVSTAAAVVAVYACFIVGVGDVPARSRPFALNPRRKKKLSHLQDICLPTATNMFLPFFFHDTSSHRDPSLFTVSVFSYS